MKTKTVRESFKFAFRGLAGALVRERNLKIHFLVAAVVIAAAALLNVSNIELALLLFSIGLVICCELINTALELAIDLYVDNYHPKAAQAKDVAAGAVLFSTVVSVIIGYLVLSAPLKEMIFK